MFTGIIENLGKIAAIKKNSSNLVFTINSPGLAKKLGESIAINGTCLTVIDFDQENFTVEAIPETLNLTNLGDLKIGDLVNLEQSLKAGSTLDGHFVVGHVDFKTNCLEVIPEGESKRIWFSLPEKYAVYFAKKGSTCINGVSLTISDIRPDSFEVCLIPYTMAKTNLGKLEKGISVNIEIDILSRYIQRQLEFLNSK
jgi:riboflavin synthase